MNTVAAPALPAAAIPKSRFYWIPLAIVAVLALAALPLIGSPSTLSLIHI